MAGPILSHVVDLLIHAKVYSNIGKKYPLEWASTILGIIAIFVVLPLYYFYRNGPAIREKSKFAKEIAENRKKDREGQNAPVSEKSTRPGHEEA